MTLFLELVGIITLAKIAYQARWIIDPASWKRGSPFLMGVWYSAGTISSTKLGAES